jgi:hypothetical protein
MRIRTRSAGNANGMAMPVLPSSRVKRKTTTSISIPPKRNQELPFPAWWFIQILHLHSVTYSFEKSGKESNPYLIQFNGAFSAEMEFSRYTS